MTRKTKKIKKLVDMELTVAFECDNCGKIQECDDKLPMDWHSFMSNHHGWDNDSIESIEHHEVCSPKCYIEKIGKILNGKYKFEKTLEIDGKDRAFALKLVLFFEELKNI